MLRSLVGSEMCIRDSLKGIRANKMFTLEGFNHNDIMCDDNGAYKNMKNVNKFYHVTFNSNYLNVIAPESEVYKVEIIYRDSKSFNGLKHTC